jgi:indole-3-glycerol phosphate synthase
MGAVHAMASRFLERILAEKAGEVAERKLARPAEGLVNRFADLAPTRDMLRALRGDSLAVIAEVKRRSPSKGAFRDDLDAAACAGAYAKAGAAAISVLTDMPNFGGTLEDLQQARLVTDVPLLRKDFIVDSYQLLEARAYGADAVLLIVAALEPELLQALYEGALELGLTPLIEINSEKEAGIARELGAEFVGINNRNLHTFDVDMGTTARLRPLVPQNAIVAALSGIGSAEDARQMRAARVDAVLVGEALVRAQDPAVLISAIRGIQ